jgi:hypothetical protein
MKVSAATVLGLLCGVVIGLLSNGNLNVPLGSQPGTLLHRDAWWVVVLSMMVPLFDYLTGVRTTLMGVITHHPYRHWAGFFAGLAVGIGLLLLLAPRLPLGLSIT